MIAPGLHGHLHLVCALDGRGHSHLRAQSFRAPMHISKPYGESGLLVVNVINPTAGLLAGDEIACEAAVEPGASLLLTAPSAARSHRMRVGGAKLTQHLEVATGAFLDVFPELFIPQSGTRYHQRTVARVASGGELLLTEMLAPGRVASGESFAYNTLRSETDLFASGELIARERYTLHPHDPSVTAMRDLYANAYYASIYAISPHLTIESSCWKTLHGLQSPTLWIGASPLCSAGHVIKLLAADSLTLRAAMTIIRRELYAALQRPVPNLRRA